MSMRAHSVEACMFVGTHGLLGRTAEKSCVLRLRPQCTLCTSVNEATWKRVALLLTRMYKPCLR